MPEDDDLGIGKSLVQLGRIGTAELIAVRDDDGKTVELDLGDLREPGSEVEAVGVSVYGRHGRQRSQLDQQVAAPDVPTMQDVIDFSEDLENSRPQQTVRIRDDTKSHLPVAGPIARAVT